MRLPLRPQNRVAVFYDRQSHFSPCVKAGRFFTPASFNASITLMIVPNEAFLSACKASADLRVGGKSRTDGLQLFRADHLAVEPDFVVLAHAHDGVLELSCRVGRRFRFRKIDLNFRLIFFESGRDDEENQKNRQDIDERNDDDGGRPPFPDCDFHGKTTGEWFTRQALGLARAKSFSGAAPLLRCRNAPVITLRDEVGDERLHFHRHHFNFFREIAERDQSRAPRSRDQRSCN